MMSRTAEIRLSVDLDSDNLPTRIEWEASEAGDNGPKPSESMLLSLWDSKEKTTAAIDLWTREMTIGDMNLFYFEVLHKMADSYLRATQNPDIAELIHRMGNEFGDAVGLRQAGDDD